MKLIYYHLLILVLFISCKSQDDGIVNLLPQFSISGTVHFLDDTPVFGITVFLMNNVDSVIASKETGVDGRYKFLNLKVANYKIEAKLIGNLLDEVRYHCPTRDVSIFNRDENFDILVGLQYPKIIESSLNGDPALYRTEDLHLGDHLEVVQHVLIIFENVNPNLENYQLYSVPNQINWTEENNNILLDDFNNSELIHEVSSSDLKFSFYNIVKIENFLNSKNGWAVTPNPGKCLIGTENWSGRVIHLGYNLWNLRE